MNKMSIGESSFELWVHEIYLKYPEVIAFWKQSSDPFTRAKALSIMKYAGGKVMDCRISPKLISDGIYGAHLENKNRFRNINSVAGSRSQGRIE